MIIQNIIQSLLSFIKLHGYLLIFIGTIFEGPVITTLSSFAASLGYFNVFIIFLISVAGDLIGDTLHFVFGRYLGKKVIIKHRENTNRNDSWLLLEKNFKEHLGKVMIFLKLIPPTTSIGLILIGSSQKVKFKKFILKSLLITAPLSLFYTLLGFFFGSVSNSILRYMRLSQYVIFFLLLSGVIVYLLMKKIKTKIEKSLKFPKSANSREKIIIKGL